MDENVIQQPGPKKRGRPKTGTHWKQKEKKEILKPSTELKFVKKCIKEGCDTVARTEEEIGQLFEKSSTAKDGYSGTCKKCRAKQKRERIRGIKAGQGTALSLNLSAYPEVMEHLPGAAKKRMRTVELQAIAYIVQGLQADGYGEAA